MRDWNEAREKALEEWLEYKKQEAIAIVAKHINQEMAQPIAIAIAASWVSDYYDEMYMIVENFGWEEDHCYALMSFSKHWRLEAEECFDKHIEHWRE